MIADLAPRADDCLRQTGHFLCLFETLRIWLTVDKFKRVDRDDFRVQLIVLCVVKEHAQPFARANAKMVATMSAHLEGFFQLTLVKMLLTTIAFYKDIFSLYDALFRRNRFDPLVFFAEPGHVFCLRQGLLRGLNHSIQRMKDKKPTPSPVEAVSRTRKWSYTVQLRASVSSFHPLRSFVLPSLSSKFYPALGAYACIEWMLDFKHLGHEIGGLDKGGGRIATGQNDMQRRL